MAICRKCIGYNTLLSIRNYSILTGVIVVNIISCRVFKGTGQFVAMIIQFGFWLAAIFWSMKIVSEKYHWIVQLSPLVYIIDGYRGSMIYRQWFWDDTNMTLYFWLVTGDIVNSIIENNLPDFECFSKEIINAK